MLIFGICAFYNRSWAFLYRVLFVVGGWCREEVRRDQGGWQDRGKFLTKNIKSTQNLTKQICRRSLGMRFLPLCPPPLLRLKNSPCQLLLSNLPPLSLLPLSRRLCRRSKRSSPPLWPPKSRKLWYAHSIPNWNEKLTSIFVSSGWIHSSPCGRNFGSGPDPGTREGAWRGEEGGACYSRTHSGWTFGNIFEVLSS